MENMAVMHVEKEDVQATYLLAALSLVDAIIQL